MITLMIWAVGMQQRWGYSHRGTVSRREGCDECAVTPAGSIIAALHCLSKSGCLRPFGRFKHWPHLHIPSSSSSSSERCAIVVKVALNMEIGNKKGRGFMGTVMHTVVHNTHTTNIMTVDGSSCVGAAVICWTVAVLSKISNADVMQHCHLAFKHKNI